MKIVYVAFCVSENTYQKLYGASSQKPGFQAQKYHRLFAEGLASHTHVDVVGYPDAESCVDAPRVVKLPREQVGNITYHYLLGFRGINRRIHLLLGSFFRCMGLLKGDSVLLIDCLNQMVGLGALLAAKLRGKPCIGIVTDLPRYWGGGLNFALAEFLIRHCTGYVVLTPAMDEAVNPKGKPSVVLEGHADAAMEAHKPSLSRKGKKRVCLYAGSIQRIYGVPKLVEGFLQANLPNTELHIYGVGDYREELEAIAASHPNVFYGGMLLPSQVVEKEMEATLLLNPRPSDEEFVRYSFPSKTMEYMSTGTPVLMTRLPCLPEEYLPYLFFIRDESPQGIARALEETLGLSDEELFSKGCQAREFVLNQRNNVTQAAKVLKMLEGELAK